MKINIIVASYNEGKRAAETLDKILKYTNSPVIVVDDGSKDKSRDLLEKACKRKSQVTLLVHTKNKGKGEAMKTGVKYAWKNRAQAVIFIDADGQHNPKFLPIFEEKLQNNDLVFGYRLLRKNVPFFRKHGNLIVRKVVRVLFGIKRRDLLCGFFGMSRKSYKKLKWSSKCYGVETEIAAKVGRLHLAFEEVKVNTTYLGKKNGMSLPDAVKVMLKIPVWYFS